MSSANKDPKPSAIEVFKNDSEYLLGDIDTELVDENNFFGKGSVQLLKHHGTYQQDDRDVRGQIQEDGSKRRFIYMVRTRIPGGRMTTDQFLAHLDLCDEVGNSTLRITSRQTLQLHGVIKSDLKATIKRINDTELTTLAACGDVARNTMCCPAPYKNNIYDELRELTDEIAESLRPQTSSYHELWITDTETGEKCLAGDESEASLSGYLGDDVEPLYGRQYLPRKFKIGITLPHDNCIDVYTHDLGLIAVLNDDNIIGYNVLVGGGQGRSPSAKKTFPALGQKLCFATREQVVSIIEAVVKVQRDYGNRADRKVARMKYLIHRWGIDTFRAKVEEYWGGPLTDPDPTDVSEHEDHMGWYEQGDGNWFYGLNVENGRLKDTETMKLKTAIRKVCQQLRPGIHLTAHQSLLFTDVADEDRAKLEDILIQHGVILSGEISNARLWSMACVAWPTCGLSITESERALPGILDQLEIALENMGLAEEKFTVRMTGCPNGCARPYNPEIGLVGRAKNKYTMFVGGARIGNRLGFIHKDMLPAEEVVPSIVKLFEYFKEDRQGDESIGDFCARKGNDALLEYVNA
ncbi:MAG: NADPH-dependent assimilatory sulfite reductase hemoprotein subunit [Planctomycetaceae bacterium]|nr:NADPH-dependent assimilatory sulfite reductase hemoprotein subunit [Planctomycetaceae bacterium]|tara:strand:+ start:318 stop:2054 length:1737 start_codon:yes stop_codon:yes gene_type:complete